MDYAELLKRAQQQTQSGSKGERYAVPQFEIEHEGNKTLVKNCAKVAAQLRRSPDHVSKFIIKESGTSGEMDGNTLVLHTKVTQHTLNEKLLKYCKQFVYCSTCEKPDTSIEESGGVIVIQCEACGEEHTAPVE